MTAEAAVRRTSPVLSHDDPRRMIPVSEAATLVGVSPRTLRTWWKNGRVDGREPGRGLLVSRAWLEEFFACGEAAS